MEAYDQDALNYHGGLRVSFAMQLMGAVERIQRVIPAIAWPFLLLQGDTDKLCDISGARLMFEQAASADKKLKVQEGPGVHCVLEAMFVFWNCGDKLMLSCIKSNLFDGIYLYR